jgi:hypothetical protein
MNPQNDIIIDEVKSEVSEENELKKYQIGRAHV